MKEVLISLTPVSVLVILPVFIVFLVLRYKINQTNKRTEIIIAAIHSNGSINVDEIIESMKPKRMSLKESLLNRLMWSTVITAVGVSVLLSAIVIDFLGGLNPFILRCGYFFGFVTTVVGGAMLWVCRMIKHKLLNQSGNDGEERQTNSVGE
ncbi:MAG: hypothetical protein ACI4AH_04955 [Muribaculaceae bacterium]